jgi:hypothetical protein
MDEAQLRKAGIIGTLVIIAAGGLLFAATMLPSSAAHPVISQVAQTGPTRTVPAAPREVAVRPTVPPLPTIARPAGVVTILPNGTATPTVSSDVQDEQATTAAGSTLGATTELATQLAHHLACIQPQAEHAPELDGQALELARHETAPLPAAGALQIEDPAGQRILIGQDRAADLLEVHSRCGETLLFGMPPLSWLSASTRFGIGVDERPDGLVVVVVTK